jgi:hypothetical protein
MKAANSWALSGIGTVPRSASRASIVGSASAARISRSRRAMTAAGVPLGRADARPGPCLVSRQCLGNRRHRRQRLEAPAAGDRERTQGARAHMRQRGDHHIKADLHLAGEQVGIMTAPPR